MKKQFKYFAFISYSSHDTAWGKRLQRKLEGYRMPAALCSEHGWKRKPIDPVFFAPYDIKPGGLTAELQDRLEASRHLIVLCSPHSARSEWVGREIAYFHSLGRTEHIHFFIIDGVPHSGDPRTECFHPVVRELGIPEILGANVHEKVFRWPWLNRERAYVQLITKLLGLEFDSLWRRHQRLLRQKMAACTLGILAVLAAFWSLYEVATMLQLLTRVRRGEPLRAGAVFRDAFCNLVRVFLPQNLPLLLYGAALIPLTNFFLAANHLTQFAVPEYLWGLLKARAANRFLFALAVLCVLALLLDGLVVLPKFLLERKSFGCAFAESLHILRSRAGQLLALALRWMLTAAARTGLMLLCGAVLFYCVILGVGFASTAALLALSRAALLIELPFLCLLMDCAMTAAQSTLTDALYEVIRQSGAAQPTVSGVLPALHREQTVLAGMMACAALVTCGVAAVYLLFPQTQPLQSVLGLADPVITYHRGYSSRAPENTMAAFETALEHGSPRIELDVQMTADGVAVVTHDTSLRRCTGCNANIYDLPYAQVQQLDAGRWFHRQFTGSYIPMLEEVLALCQGKAELNIEIKPSTFTPNLEAETVRLIHAYDYGADCVVTSQSYETLCKVKELDPDITTGYILALGVGTYYDLPAADFFSVESTFITAGMVQQIHLRGKTISAWTINRQQDAEKLLQLGVDDLITDKPEIIAPLLARDKALDNRLLWLRDQIQELLAAPDSEEAMEVEETIEDAIEDPKEVLDEA